MDQDYIDIETHVRHAQELRSQAMAELISAALRKFKKLFKNLQYPEMPRTAVAEKSSAYMKVQYLP
jgi:hypothetical protein